MWLLVRTIVPGSLEVVTTTLMQEAPYSALIQATTPIALVSSSEGGKGWSPLLQIALASGWEVVKWRGMEEVLLSKVWRRAAPDRLLLLPQGQSLPIPRPVIVLLQFSHSFPHPSVHTAHARSGHPWDWERVRPCQPLADDWQGRPKSGRIRD